TRCAPTTAGTGTSHAPCRPPPSSPSRTPTPAFDKARYRRRSAVERCVSKWKRFRAVASRYDKRDYIFNDTLTVTAIVIRLRDTVQEPSETT
ncbi:hypothetical protein ABT329_40965, partial [Streptomyces minutiscleroticus]